MKTEEALSIFHAEMRNFLNLYQWLNPFTIQAFKESFIINLTIYDALETIFLARSLIYARNHIACSGLPTVEKFSDKTHSPTTSFRWAFMKHFGNCSQPETLN